MAHSENDYEVLLDRARWLAEQPEKAFGACEGDDSKNFAPGFIGYGDIPPNARVLIASDNQRDPAIANAIADALREKGATVDIVVTDVGPDREIEEEDELTALIRNADWHGNPRYDARRYNDVPWITEMLANGGYDLLIQGRAYTFERPCRWDGFIWNQADTFLQDANLFPRDLHTLINTKSWARVFETGRGAKVHVTDPEGTDFTWTLLEEYWDESIHPMGMKAEPTLNHHMYHPAPPILPNEDASGVVCGTLAHFSKPFPLITITLENGRVESIEGGGKYGDAWRKLKAETDDIQYPQFPDKGMFWFWEAALGTNPKVRRPKDVRNMSTGGTEWERFRSGVLHLGFGTAGPSEQEAWAGRQGIPYGHLHIHMQFPTIELIRPDGSTEKMVENGHLLILDDPEVRELAAKYGDPDEVLNVDWVPPIPGISIPGDFEVYAKDPTKWFFGEEAEATS